MEQDKSKKENLEKLAKMFFCMCYLYHQGLITASEEDNIYKRIRHFQKTFRVEISDEQLESVNLVYGYNNNLI